MFGDAADAAAAHESRSGVRPSSSSSKSSAGYASLQCGQQDAHEALREDADDATTG